jgi:hypothetical protein
MRVHLNSPLCYHSAMVRKLKPPPDDPEQSKRFIKAAREIGTDESPKEFERVFKRVVRKPIPRQKTNQS